VFGKGYNVLPIWKDRLHAKTLVTTPNSDVIYAMGYLDLKEAYTTRGPFTGETAGRRLRPNAKRGGHDGRTRMIWEFTGSAGRKCREALTKGRCRKGGVMQQPIVVALLASIAWAFVGGTALGQVAGSTTIGVTVEEQKVLALGWSAKKHVLGKDVYNSSDEKIGVVEDLIIAPDKAVSYAIVGTGGFLGIDRHDVAIPAGQLKLQGDKLTLPGATKEGLKALPKFEYAK
jgi:sporulation protein YlmC with PRC-barrel domain